MKVATKVNCLVCGAEAIQKTAKQRLFCTHKCRRTYWNRHPDTKQKLREYYKDMRLEAIKQYGGKCKCCGEPNYEFLAFDHIHGGGTQFRKQAKSSRIEIYLKNNDYPKDIRLLCHNCNSALGFYGYCPHERL